MDLTFLIGRIAFIGLGLTAAILIVSFLGRLVQDAAENTEYDDGDDR